MAKRITDTMYKILTNMSQTILYSYKNILIYVLKYI